jgi:hypothetical protein
MHALDVATHQRSGVDDGNARALAQGAGLKEEEKVESNLRLALHEAVVGEPDGELLAHVLADVAEEEGLQVAVTGSVEEDKDAHYFGVRHAVLAIAALLSWNINEVFFQFWLKNLAEFIE